MSKVKMTAKAIRNMPEPKVKIGYCLAQYLLRYRQPFAYTAGIYGWNFDAYDLGGLIVCTGYRNMPGVSVNDLARDYDGRAEAVCLDFDRDWGQRRDKVEALLAEFRARALERINPR